MPFKKGQSGNPAGRKRGTSAVQHKVWFLNYLIDELQRDPEQLKKDVQTLRKENFDKLCDIIVRLMPREQQIDLTAQIFANWSDEDLAKFAATGEGPEG